ncbi:MAG: hypothetical protein AAGE01_11245, partial [Pseudomonadota bacterium]
MRKHWVGVAILFMAFASAQAECLDENAKGCGGFCSTNGFTCSSEGEGFCGCLFDASMGRCTEASRSCISDAQCIGAGSCAFEGTCEAPIEVEEPPRATLNVFFEALGQALLSTGSSYDGRWAPENFVFLGDRRFSATGVFAEVHVDGRQNPSNCISILARNDNETPVDLLFRFEMPIEPLEGPFQITSFVDGQLFDVDGDGASLEGTDGGLILRAFVAKADFSDFENLPQVGPPGATGGFFFPDPLGPEPGPVAPDGGWELLSVAADFTLSPMD